jgi:uncharacterized protein YceH (UPF0502 family)
VTRIETSRVKEVLGMTVTSVKEAASRLSADSDLQELEKEVADLEKAVADLKGSLAGLPFKHSS